MKLSMTWTLPLAALLALAGCGGSVSTATPAKTPDGKTITDSSGQAVSAAAADKFNSGIDALTAHDKAGDWSEATCKQTAELFLAAAKEQGEKTFAEAIYNAGLAYQRCKMQGEAKAKFQEALQSSSKFHQARVQLALYAFADSGEKDVDKAIGELQQAVKDAEFKNVEALVNLAMMQMRRGNNEADSDGKNDLERAKKNLQRALAVDDAFMPAFNQLAIYYLEAAKAKAGRSSGRRVTVGSGKQKKIDTQALELAALVCSQAVRKNPSYAPIHNTAGLIQVELGNLNAAVQEFNTARKLDPGFVEAQMNFAAVNLQFRGFKQAEDAYRGAIKMAPNDYEAHLGLALALRGQIDDSNFDKMVAAASEELAAAKRIDGNRPEAYYNEAILTQEYKAKGGGASSEKPLLAAKDLFAQFIQKATAPEFADAVKRSKERMAEIDQIIEFNKQTESERKAAEADQRQKEAEAEARGETGETPPADGAAPPAP